MLFLQYYVLYLLSLTVGGAYQTGKIEFDGDTLNISDTATSDEASVVYKLDSNGNIQCSSIIPIGTWGGFIPIVASDTSGNHVYIGGIAQSEAIFGKDTINPFVVPGGHPYTVNGFPFIARWEECDSSVITAGVPVQKPIGREVKVYPNPNNGTFTLLVSNVNAVCNVEIYNILGEKVFTETLLQSQSNNTIDLTGQPSGVYFYRVLSEDRGLIGEGKIVVQK